MEMVSEKSPQVKKAVVRLMELSNDERTRMLHDSYMRKEWSIQGQKRWVRNDERLVIAKNALHKNMSIEDIADITGLTQAEIEGLKNAD